jgi:general secretion pathway protein H
MTPRRSAPAFTLVELMIVIAVIALLSAAAVPALGGLTGTDARKGAGEVAGSMRWLFDSASVRNTTCRLVIDPAERSFWAECAPRGTTIEKDPVRAREREAALAEKGSEKDPKDELGKVSGTGFAAFTDPVVRKRELPGSATFKAVKIDGRDALEGGKPAFIHFFAGGRAQAARVTIADGDHAFTIRLEPFTGRARVTAGEPTGRDE